jgi:hypothetical protein
MSEPAFERAESRADSYLMTTRQAAYFLGIAEHSLRDLMHRKINPLPYINLPTSSSPKFTKQLLIEYINSCCTDPRFLKGDKS